MSSLMNTEIPLVSICIPAHNHEKFIKQTIESIVHQKINFKYELHIGDDCSTDNTLRICKEYQIQYPEILKIYDAVKPIGNTLHFIRLLKQCKGKYIALCEGDSYWINDNKLQIQVDFLERNSDHVMCFGNVYHKTNLSLISNTLNSDNLLIELFTSKDLLEENRIFSSTVLFRNPYDLPRSFEKAVFPDWVLWYYLSLKGKIKFLNEYFSVSGNHINNISEHLDINKTVKAFLITYKIFQINTDKKELKELIKNKIKSLKKQRRSYKALQLAGYITAFNTRLNQKIRSAIFSQNKGKEKKLLINVFSTNFPKRILLSYILFPFLKIENHGHTNFDECLIVANYFNNQGFQVDVADWNDNETDINYSQYDVIFGLGHPIENSFYSEGTEKIFRIFYGTGIQFNLLSINSARRVKDFYDRNHVYLPDSGRILKSSWVLQYVLSDAIIALGNNYVENTYKTLCPEQRVYPLNTFFYKTSFKIEFEKKDFANSKRHFLWFGSSGLIHKGLDIVLEFFITNPDFTIHICGAPNEEKFFNYFENKYAGYQHNNIINHGFVNINSSEFEQILYSCGSVIFPSSSEGGAPSLLTVLGNGGLFPIVSSTCGVDILEDGIVLEAINYASLHKAIFEYQLIPIEELKLKSERIRDFYQKNYSQENYKCNMTYLLDEICSLKKN
jgi:glycosyltransferase involved in cell wall biosynthesis